MNYFIEIELLSDGDIPVNFLWEKIYPQIHLALVEIRKDGKSNVGVSFPKYDAEKFQLGNVIRFFAKTRVELENLRLKNSCSRLLDYLRISTIEEVPLDVLGYCYFSRHRVKTKSSLTRLIRRKAKRENMSYEDALSFYSGKEKGTSRLPFVRIRSQSTNSSPYPLLIEKVEASGLHDGAFSTYGLSSSSSVPLF